MQGWQQDVRFAFRRLARTPGPLAAAIVSIALGIAANTTIFSVVSAVVFQRPTITDPDRLLTLHTAERNDCCSEFSWLLYKDIAEQTRSFSGVTARFPLVSAAIGGAGEPQLHWGQLVSSNFFGVNGVPMGLGRGFSADEDRANVVVISHSLWRTRFSSDPGILGRKILLAGQPYSVAGVTAPGFRGIDLALQSDYWLPLGMAPQVLKTVPDRDSRTTSWLSVTARLRPGVTRAQAESELEMLGARLTKAFPSAYTQLHFRTGETGILMPAFKSQVMMFLGALLVVVLLVLLIACTNVANLLLAQANARRKEIAVRLALGASRGQIMRQMFVESLLLALAGGLAGVVISIWAVQALAAFRLPLPIPIAVDLAIDWRVLGWTCCLSLGSGLLFGLAPALAAGRVALTGALKGEDAFSGASRRWNVRHALVFGQVALSMLLLCATGLFLRSLGEARSIPIGFRASGLSLLSVDPMASGYSRERTVALLQEIERRAAALPGVESAAFTDLVPLSIGGSSSTLTVEGVRQQPAGNRSADFFLVSPSYFRTLGVPLIAGRGFAGETSPQRFAVVNETLVKRLFEGHNPIGRRVRSGQDSYEIIGVVKDTKSRTIGEAPRAVMYRQISQDLTRDAGFLGFTLITKAPPGLLPALRKEIRSLDPNLPVQRVETIEEHLRNALFLPRLAGSLFGIFGVTGLLLASVGLYGVMSYSVSRRTREIGIRMALGAEVSTVRAMVVNQGMLIAGAAMVVGLAAALAAAKLAAGILYGIKPHDPLTFVMVTGSLGFIALLACWIPARRAARVQPITALRYE